MSSISEGDLNPRPLHYVFAHYTLREEAFLATDQLINALREQDQDYIRHQWFKAIIGCRGSGTQIDKEAVPIEEIRVYSAQQDGITCYLIGMPEAKHMTEAFFVAVVQAPEGVVRYYTLEKGFSDEGPRTIFCEWTADGQHLSFGDGPPATVDAFTERVFRQIKSELLSAS